MNKMAELHKRQEIISYCLKLNASGLNQGTSGNISIRHGDGFLISPTATPYEDMTQKMISFVGFDGRAAGPLPPSSEWRFHRDIYTAREDVNAVVHAHPAHCTALAIHSREIPPVHYMVAIFGGKNVRVAPYATYGTQELSDGVCTALNNRFACLIAHHGAIALGASIEQAFWRMEELETLAQQYLLACQLGNPPELSNEQMEAALGKISGCDLSDKL